MKNSVKSKTSGNEFEVIVSLSGNGKGGENYSKVIVQGVERSAYWFLHDNGELHCLCTWNDGKSGLDGVLEKRDSEMQAWIDMKLANRKLQQADIDEAKNSQMYGY